ncbi:MAG: aminopeptidase N, partial [Spongiibacteraceae bacterium]|nr:aminopeptidase N [Spongiibacteraceae bacterium]
MRDAQPRTIRLSDYRVPDFLVDTIELHFRLDEAQTRVGSRLALRRNPAGVAGAPLVLNGVELELQEVSLDGRRLDATEYQVDAEQLILDKLPAECVLEIETLIRPQENTSLEGLYKSRTMFCTQCEAEGFRKITYFPDRPDVMATYTVTLEADRDRYPVLLSNGNCVAQGNCEGNRHYATWHDPFPKPSYLFALVAGDLTAIEDRFTTMSGREVALRIWVEEKDADKCDHAMVSLKNAMRWDEEVYGREYDLDIFNIVAVDDFNMGAMENKSLNIFNTSCVLARPETTTDAGFQRVESVVAHEYFHNWSGNRVTCRDWFQLSLKEGLTVFRDAEFSADMGSRTVKRVEDVTLLRTQQFAEDAGPMAHPVRPDSYMEISNFYTLTIYEKGAEVVRMLHTLLGSELFRRGTDLYFERHDGEAVTCDDFVRAMEEVSGRDLTQFRRWYSQAGTPVLEVAGAYDAVAARYTLTVRQHCPPTPGQPEKLPFHLPFAVALLGQNGPLQVRLGDQRQTDWVIDITQAEQQIVFEGVAEEPV